MNSELHALLASLGEVSAQGEVGAQGEVRAVNFEFSIEVHSLARDTELPCRNAAGDRSKGNLVFLGATRNETVGVLIENIGDKSWNVMWKTGVKRIRPRGKVLCELTVSDYDNVDHTGNSAAVAYVVICPETRQLPPVDIPWNDVDVTYCIKVTSDNT